MMKVTDQLAKCPRCHEDVLVGWDDCLACGATLPAKPYQTVRPSGGKGWKIAFGVWNALMAIWLISGMVAVGDSYNDCAGDAYREACEAGTSIGAAAGIGFVLFVAVAVNVVMGVIYACTRPRQVIIVQAPH